MSWHEFINRLVRSGAQHLPVVTWKMSDGALLHAPVPALADAADDQDLAEFTRGYKLHEIVAVEFDFSSAPAQVAAELDAIEQTARVSGLIYRRKPYSIVVRLAYTC